jgi:hypothetical protein
MSRDTAGRLLGRTRPGPGTVRQVAVPPDARALSTLSHIDYEDAFLVDVPTREWTAEQFARAILDDAPISIRRALMTGELLFKRQQHTLLFATFVQQDNHLARATWAGVEPVHVQVVRYVLAQRI